ncbi:MAG: outer membrane beta-barrel protein [Cruoricaptor ignavus]|nr:outer membrane beta-barrel protein [Cruoricaptor ignavus]
MSRFFLIFFFLFIHFSNAQLVREISYGVFGGGIYSKMNNIESMLIPQGMYQNYQTSERAKLNLMGGVFLNWKYPGERISFQPELYYTKQSTVFEYQDTKGLHYTISFPSNNLNAGFLFKYYITDGFYLGAGPYLTFHLDKDGLMYQSNGAELMTRTGVYFEPDALVQKTLKESFKGKDYFHTAFALGYEFGNGLNFSIRYHLGLGDTWETQENGHRFTNTNNKTSAFSLQIGYRFAFDGHNNF